MAFDERSCALNPEWINGRSALSDTARFPLWQRISITGSSSFEGSIVATKEILARHFQINRLRRRELAWKTQCLSDAEIAEVIVLMAEKQAALFRPHKKPVRIIAGAGPRCFITQQMIDEFISRMSRCQVTSSIERVRWALGYPD